MTLNKDINSKKVPAYVEVYNRLYHDILHGVYQDGQLLPSENQLSKEYNISRNTLRQALAVLMQDGLIYKEQGKGTFVMNESQTHKKIYNYIFEGKEMLITNVTMDYNINKPTEIAQNRLGLEGQQRVLACDSSYFSGATVIAHSFLQIPIDIIQSDKINLESKEELFDLINNKIYQKSSESKMTVQCILAGVLEVEHLMVNEGTPLLYVEQVLMDGSGKPTARIKYYLRIEYYKISIN